LSNQSKEKDTPKRVEWKPNTKIVMKIEETLQKKSKEQEEKK